MQLEMADTRERCIKSRQCQQCIHIFDILQIVFDKWKENIDKEQLYYVKQ